MKGSDRLTVEDIVPGLAGGSGPRRGRRIDVRASRQRSGSGDGGTQGGAGPADPKFWDKQEAGLAQLLDMLLSDDNRESVDSWNIDDRDLPAFPNFFEFCKSKSGLYTRLYARQMWLAVHLLVEWCPICSPKRKSFRHVKRIPVGFDVMDLPDKITLLEYGRCPSCGATKGDLVRKGELNPYGELVAIIGQRSGKSLTLSLIVAYLIHCWLKVGNPVEALGLVRNSVLTGTVVGLTYQKAVELMWTPIYSAMLQSEWFTEYHKMLDHHAKESGRDIYKFRPTYIQYNHKNILLTPSGPNKRTLRGNTRIIGVVDELGWYPHGEEKEHLEKAGANELYTALDNSLATVRGKALRLAAGSMPHMPIAYMMSISSPSSYWDKIMSLERSHKGSRDVLTCRLATWEFNPEMPRSDPFIQKKYREDPVKAERDFAANPPMAASPWLGDISPILSAANGEGAGTLKYRYAYVTSRSGQRQVYAEIKAADRGRGAHGRILALDAGHVNNSFAMAVVEPVPRPLRGSPSGAGDSDRVYGARVVALAEVPPVRGESPVNYTHLYRSLIGPLVEMFDVRFVVADRWESIKMLSDLEEDYGVGTQQYSLKPADLSMVRDYLVDEDDPRISLPKAEMSYERMIKRAGAGDYPGCFKYAPVTHLIYQFMVTNEDDRGMMSKGHGATDDLLRAAVLGMVLALDEEFVVANGLFSGAAGDSGKGAGIVHGAGSLPSAGLRPVSVNGASQSSGRMVSAGARATGMPPPGRR